MKKEEMENYFNILNKKEDNLDIKSIDILEFRVYSEINFKMNKIYDELEQILDTNLNTKNPLGIDSHLNYLYNFVKEKRKNEKRKDIKCAIKRIKFA